MKPLFLKDLENFKEERGFRLILVMDASFALHRARFVAGKNGTPTRDHTIAIFMKILFKMIQKFSASKVYLCFDGQRSFHRLKLYPDYKGHRKNDDADLTFAAYKKARDFLVCTLPKLGFITILEDGIEADDFAYLISHIQHKNHVGVHVTDDRDWFLGLFPGWSLYRPKADELITYQQFCAMVSHEKNPRMIYLITRAIVGDKSDNISGIRGVPWEQALLLAPYILERNDLGDGKYAKKVRDKIDQVYFNIKLMTPMWIISSETARIALDAAEKNVQKDFPNPFDCWQKFYAQIEEHDPRTEIRRASFDYNFLIRGLEIL